VWHYLRDPTFSHFDTIPECDRQTHDDGIYRASIASRHKRHSTAQHWLCPFQRFVSSPDGNTEARDDIMSKSDSINNFKSTWDYCISRLIVSPK